MHNRHRWIFVAAFLVACGDTPLTGDDASAPDLAAAHDLAVGDDLAAAPDLASTADLAAVADLAPAADLAMAYTLTVTRSGSGTGTVTAADGSIDCGGLCGASYLAGSAVTLSATASNAPATQSTFVGWSGAGCSGKGACVVAMTQAQAVTAQFRLDPNLAFVTDATFAADFGSPQNADALCAAAATAASRPGAYKAMISSAGSTAAVRLGAASGWVRLDGRPFANTLAEISQSKVFYPLRLSETGADVGQASVWTACSYSGTFSGSDCQGWSSLGGTDTGDTGQSSGSGTMSISFNGLNCAQKARLYCFGVDRTASVAPAAPPATHRTAFVTAGTFNTTGGLAAADALCAGEATAAGLAGTYAAMLPDVGASAASRFDTSSGGPWVRPDGVVVHQDVASMFTTPLWDAAISVTAAGAYIDNASVWGGASRPDVVGAAGFTCQGWTSASGSAAAGRAGFSHVASALSLDSNSSCGQAFRVYCLQQ